MKNPIQYIKPVVNYMLGTMLCALLFVTLAHAQDSTKAQRGNPAIREQIATLKIGFITQKLNLTPEEAKVFWPVYNQYDEELEQLRKSRRDNLLNAKMNFDEMSNAEVEK